MNEIPQRIHQKIPVTGFFATNAITQYKSAGADKLSVSEQKTLKGFQNSKRKSEYLASRLLLKDMAGHWLKSDGKLSVLKDELGQPYGMLNGEQYYLSIAHTSDAIFGGITRDYPIGIDLEPLNRNLPESLADRITHPNEGQEIKDIPTLRLWTIKEAFIKLLGQGLRLNMNEVEVSFNDGFYFAKSDNEKNAQICSFQSENNWMAIAYFN